MFCLNFLLALSSTYSQEHILCGTTFTDEENAVKTQTPSWDPELSTLVPSLHSHSLNGNGLPQAHAFLSAWSPAGGTVLEGVEVQELEPCQRKWVRWEQTLRFDSFTPAAVLCYLNSETL